MWKRKKFKRCCQVLLRPRTRSVILDMGEPVSMRAVEIDSVGRIFMESSFGRRSPIAAKLETSYSRTTSDKDHDQYGGESMELPDHHSSYFRLWTYGDHGA